MDISDDIKNAYYDGYDSGYNAGFEAGQRDVLLKEQEPDRKPGKWMIYIISMLDGEGCKCSECGSEGAPYWDYCPNCGTRMEGAEQE